MTAKIFILIIILCILGATVLIWRGANPSEGPTKCVGGTCDISGNCMGTLSRGGGPCASTTCGDKCSPHPEKPFPEGVELVLGNGSHGSLESKVFLPKNLVCSPETCPTAYGTCVAKGDEIKYSDISLAGQFAGKVCSYDTAKGFTPLYGYTKNNKPQLTCTYYCDLGLNDPTSYYGCSGAIGAPKKFVQDVKKWLIDNNKLSPSGTKITADSVFGVGAAPPLMMGNSPFSYTTPSSTDSTYQGQTNNSGVIYEIRTSGKVAFVLLIDRCAGYVHGAGTSSGKCGKGTLKFGCDLTGTTDVVHAKEGGECLEEWNKDPSSTDIRPMCPCVGSVKGVDNAKGGQCCGKGDDCCGKGNAYADCDWCASNNHPHIDLDIDVYNHLSSDQKGHFEPEFVHYWQVVPPNMFQFGAGMCPSPSYIGKCTDSTGHTFNSKLDDSVSCCCPSSSWVNNTCQSKHTPSVSGMCQPTDKTPSNLKSWCSAVYTADKCQQDSPHHCKWVDNSS